MAHSNENQRGYEINEVNDVIIDLNLLAKQSQLYKALVNFKGTDSLDVLTYPEGKAFSKECFISVINCLGSEEAFSENLHNFPIEELFNVSLYLGSDSLLYHIVFDLLETRTCVTILDLAINALGENHFITRGVIHFITKVLDTTFDTILFTIKQSKSKLRKMIKNSRRQDRRFIIESRTPQNCLLCNHPIIDNVIKDAEKRLSPMNCCGMMFHLQCQLKLFKEKKYPKCPACGTIYADGKIDIDLNVLDSKMTIRYLDNYGIHPLPFRVRSEIWK